MSDAPEQSVTPGPRGRLRQLFAVYAAELTAGLVAGLAFFLAVLWLLHAAFPNSSGLGNLVREHGEGLTTHARLYVEAPGAVVASLTDVRGVVRDKPDSSVLWAVTEEGQSLGDRHAVQSYANSGANIVFDDATRLELGEKSVVVVRRPRRVESTYHRRASVMFIDGFLRGRFGNAVDGLQVELVAAGGTVRPVVAADGPAQIALAVHGEKSSLSVERGAVEVLWGDEVTLVPQGHTLTYDDRTPPGAPEPQPQAPQLLAPPYGARFSYRATPSAVRMHWRAAGFDEAQLQIALDPEFHTVLFDERLRADELTHENLGAGEYWWRVRPYRGSIAGPLSDAGRFSVSRDDVPPELRVEIPAGTVREARLRIAGRTEPGARVVIGDASPEVGAEGTFEHRMLLEDGYNFVVVQAIDAAGNTAFSNHSILAELDGAGSEP